MGCKCHIVGHLQQTCSKDAKRKYMRKKRMEDFDFNDAYAVSP